MNDWRPITEATTDELLEELLSRFDYSVFAGVIRRSEGESEIATHSRGSYHECAGLALSMASQNIRGTDPQEQGDEPQ